METATVDAPLVIASLLILAVLVGSAALWIRRIQQPRNLVPVEKGVASWNIGWINFGIFLCAMIIAVFFAQQLGLALLLEPGDGAPELTPWLAVASVILLQGPMIAVFYLARRFYPGHYADRLNSLDLCYGEAFKKAVPLFVMLLPVIWIATLIWSGALTLMEQAGLIDEFAPQELVTLFQDGGDFTAMVLLVAMAIIVAPIVEEIIFRGCIYRFLKSKTTMLGAQFTSGAIFAVMHGNLLSFVPLVIVGVLLARVYEKTGNLTVAIWFHAFFNAFSLGMLFITGMSDSIPPEY